MFSFSKKPNPCPCDIPQIDLGDPPAPQDSPARTSGMSVRPRLTALTECANLAAELQKCIVEASLPRQGIRLIHITSMLSSGVAWVASWNGYKCNTRTSGGVLHTLLRCWNSIGGRSSCNAVTTLWGGAGIFLTATCAPLPVSSRLLIFFGYCLEENFCLQCLKQYCPQYFWWLSSSLVLNWFRRFGQTIPESWCNSWNATFTKYSLKSITNIDEWKFSENTISNIPAGRLWCQLGASWILRQVVILTSSPSLSCQGNMPRNSCTKQENYTYIPKLSLHPSLYCEAN